MRKQHLTITIEFPALDRLLNAWDASQQSTVDALQAELVSLKAELTKHRTGLETATDKETQNNAS